MRLSILLAILAVTTACSGSPAAAPTPASTATATATAAATQAALSTRTPRPAATATAAPTATGPGPDQSAALRTYLTKNFSGPDVPWWPNITGIQAQDGIAHISTNLPESDANRPTARAICVATRRADTVQIESAIILFANDRQAASCTPTTLGN